MKPEYKDSCGITVLLNKIFKKGWKSLWTLKLSHSTWKNISFFSLQSDITYCIPFLFQIHMYIYYILWWNPVIWLVNTKSLFFYNDRWKRILTRTSCLVFTFASVKYGVEYESSQVCEFQWGRFERNSKQLWGREYQKINKDSCKRFSGIFTF